MKQRVYNIDSTSIPESIRHAIKLGLNSWLVPCKKVMFANAIQNLPDDVLDIYKKQGSIIGWEHFVKGRLSISWDDIVYQHLARIHDNFDTEAWGTKLGSINFKYILQFGNINARKNTVEMQKPSNYYWKK